MEKAISEQNEFFHLYKVSSSMVIKVDFDLTMSIFAHDLIRLLSMDLSRYSHSADFAVFNKFFFMSGTTEVKSNEIRVKMKKKRNLPALLYRDGIISKKAIFILGIRKLIFTCYPASYFFHL